MFDPMSDRVGSHRSLVVRIDGKPYRESNGGDAMVVLAQLAARMTIELRRARDELDPDLAERIEHKLDGINLARRAVAGVCASFLPLNPETVEEYLDDVARTVIRDPNARPRLFIEVAEDSVERPGKRVRPSRSLVRDLPVFGFAP